jgi:hypothetical protein
MVQKTYGWGVTLSEMVADNAFVIIPTPDFDADQVDTEKAEVAYGGHLLTPEQFALNWAQDGSKVNVVNRSGHTWEIHQGVYVSCPRLAPDTGSLDDIANELADHAVTLNDHEDRLGVLETSQAAQDSAITDLQGRVAALEAVAPAAQAKKK